MQFITIVLFQNNEGMNLKVRLTIMNFLEFAVWGAYLTSMGSYLAQVGQAENIGWFYSIQGIVSLFMPALVGIIGPSARTGCSRR